MHHGALVIVRGGAAQLLRFQHADGSSYGELGSSPAAIPLSDPIVLDVHAKVCAGLCRLGFREREVRAVLAQLRARLDGSTPTAAQLLRQALLRLTPHRARE